MAYSGNARIRGRTMNAKFLKKLLPLPTAGKQVSIGSGILYTVLLSSFTSTAFAHHS